MGKVLVAEDEANVRESLVLLLEAEGHRVVEAEDGALALQKVKSDRPDVLLLDNMMPKLDGIEVLEKLRQDSATASLPVIMITAKNSPADRHAAVRLGVVDYIHKPWADGEIELRVKWALKAGATVPAVPWDLSDAERAAGPRTGLPGGKADSPAENVSAGSSPARASSGPLKTVEVITPLEGGSVQTDDGRLRVDLPSGSVPETMALGAKRVDEAVPPIPASLRLKMGQTVADLTFTDRTGAPIEGVELDKPAKITVRYTQEDLGKESPKDLKIRKLNQETGRWVGMDTEVDPESHTAVTHETEFSRPPQRDNARVLVVEDDEEDREALRKVLERAGYEVLTEGRAEQAYDRVFKTMPDVVIVDLDLPRMDGFQVLRALKGDSRTRAASVIMLGSDIGQDNYAASMTLGARDLVAKPWHTGDLQNRVHRAYEASRARLRQAERAVARARARFASRADPRMDERSLERRRAKQARARPGGAVQKNVRKRPAA